MSAGGGARIMVDRLGPEPRETVLTPDSAARADLARRLDLVELPALTCRFALTRHRAAEVMARGTLEARVVQEDVATLEAFEAPVHDDFVLRFVPEEELRDALDPDDPVDEVGYSGGAIDLGEAMCQQLALALDPYPRQAGGEE